MSGMPRIDGRELARVVVFAALIVALGFVAPIPVPGLVPITAQTLGVMLAGAVLGRRGGAAAVGLVLLLVVVGLPVLSGGRGGLGVFFGATAGYLLGWLVGAYIVGAIAHGGRSATAWRDAVAVLIGGIGVVYALGVPVQALVTGVPLGETALMSLAFLPGDLVKAVCAVAVVGVLRRAYPVALGARTRIDAAAQA